MLGLKGSGSSKMLGLKGRQIDSSRRSPEKEAAATGAPVGAKELIESCWLRFLAFFASWRLKQLNRQDAKNAKKTQINRHRKICGLHSPITQSGPGWQAGLESPGREMFI
jgi:hypothetical protein